MNKITINIKNIHNPAEYYALSYDEKNVWLTNPQGKSIRFEKNEAFEALDEYFKKNEY